MILSETGCESDFFQFDIYLKEKQYLCSSKNINN